MKKLSKFWIVTGAVLALVLTGVAQAVAPQLFRVPVDMRAGAWLGSTASQTAGNKITNALSASATIDFASTSVGVVESSGITVTGAVVGDTCTVGVPAAAGALKAKFECYVSAADTVKVKFTPMAEDQGTTSALNGASPAVATATVTAGAVCNCSLNGASAASAAKGCAVGVSSTTLTVTSANAANETVNYYCRAPVDPASSTYFVRTFSAQ